GAECKRHKDVCRGIHAQSVRGTAFETFSLEPYSLSSAKNHAEAKEKDTFSFIPIDHARHRKVVPRAAVRKRGRRTEVGYCGRGYVSFRTRRRGSGRQGGCRRTSHASGGRRAAANCVAGGLPRCAGPSRRRCGGR